MVTWFIAGGCCYAMESPRSGDFWVRQPVPVLFNAISLVGHLSSLREGLMPTRIERPH